MSDDQTVNVTLTIAQLKKLLKAERERCVKACDELLSYDYDDPASSFIAAIDALGDAE